MVHCCRVLECFRQLSSEGPSRGAFAEHLDAINNPEDQTAGTRKRPISRELYIEQDDFMEVLPPNFFRLKPDGEVR